jgi:dihydrofolate synthase/folylpolyglutamate synthase
VARFAGVRLWKFPARARRPAVILDVAHNPQAVTELAQNLDALGTSGKRSPSSACWPTGYRRGAAGAGREDRCVAAGRAGRAARRASATLAAVVESGGLGGRVECHPSPVEAFRRAVGLAGENDRIAVFGSFYTVAAVLREIA